jgi:hypothetical protein
MNFLLKLENTKNGTTNYSTSDDLFVISYKQAIIKVLREGDNNGKIDF